MDWVIVSDFDFVLIYVCSMVGMVVMEWMKKLDVVFVKFVSLFNSWIFLYMYRYFKFNFYRLFFCNEDYLYESKVKCKY